MGLTIIMNIGMKKISILTNNLFEKSTESSITNKF